MRLKDFVWRWTTAKGRMREKTKQVVPLSSAAAIWRPSSAQSVTPDVWPKNRKHKPTVRLEEQGREVARSTSLPYAMEDLCLQAGSNKTNVCLYSRKSSTLTVSWHSVLIKSSCHLLCWRKCFRSLCGLSSMIWGGTQWACTASKVYQKCCFSHSRWRKRIICILMLLLLNFRE